MNNESLKAMRSVFVPKKKKLYIHYELTDTQRAFQLGKELAFNYLKLKDRIYTSTFLQINSFDEILTNFKASYFAVALLINRDNLVKDLSQFFKLNRWNSTALFAIIDKYQASPEMFLQRLVSVMPKFFGINELFFLRFNNKPGINKFYLTKEIHLPRQQEPYGNEIEEHYCRRWVSLWLLNDLHRIQQSGRYQKPIIGVQRSRYIGTDNEYFCITIARPGNPTPETNISVTVGFLLNDKLKETFTFWDDDNIPVQEVNNTCERCSVKDCEQRVQPPSVVEFYQRRENIETALDNLIKEA
jgi:predicted transcriptional regulator